MDRKLYDEILGIILDLGYNYSQGLAIIKELQKRIKDESNDREGI